MYIYIFFLKKFEKVEKTGIIFTKVSLRCTPSVILGLISILEFDQNSNILLNRNNKPIFDVELYDPIEKTWTIDEKRALPYLIHK